MKKLIGILTLGIAALVATPTADARHYHRPSRTYVEFHRSCRGPAYIERYVAYYDRHGCAVWRTRVIPIRHHHHHRPHVEVRWSSGGGYCR
ncbi:hypothetical protein OJ996_06510 [Luteolibacter sp. GHJ8]|jgi:hypothetical protein|uniref:Uncharacterized protein n=1 Tax=Luteolibacter rhizosphaerae TaxID=2989719 RepID=A0ABT3G055_9BACT|nr:hypothetical protein [Luteolibacter rhizosphaerae]MCW1913215.1 hypothetical protein [Luteolibacter rhizosphaerae]